MLEWLVLLIYQAAFHLSFEFLKPNTWPHFLLQRRNANRVLTALALVQELRGHYPKVPLICI